ncbi:hypothetical protein RIEGSTA812A_PEG_279 [invertebrate metagenome]|uniref:Uncharacterized protein n=1 Tax=invertebrate metagenome TaxID=1711999 RepID=A0A484H4P7_9ZZZZ
MNECTGAGLSGQRLLFLRSTVGSNFPAASSSESAAACPKKENRLSLCAGLLE